MISAKNKALVNYYAKLIQKKSKSIDDVPENLVKEVNEALEALGEYIPREGEAI
jgi:hypothetical protein